ncbi:hypothetical protein ACLKA6_016596 [Drosophila palustris]
MGGRKFNTGYERHWTMDSGQWTLVGQKRQPAECLCAAICLITQTQTQARQPSWQQQEQEEGGKWPLQLYFNNTKQQQPIETSTTTTTTTTGDCHSRGRLGKKTFPSQAFKLNLSAKCFKKVTSHTTKGERLKG